MVVDKQKIIQFITMNGPTLPVQIVKEFGQDTIIIGAILSELTTAKSVAVSDLKVGGSPLYYIENQKFKLQHFSDHLNGKDKEAYQLLKQKGVLHDRPLTPLLRVSLRMIKDFAMPVKVEVEGREELFWRWYLLPMQGIEEKIRDILMPGSNKPDNGEESKTKEIEKEKEPIDEKSPSERTEPEEEPESKELYSSESSSTQKHLQKEVEDSLHEKVKKLFLEKNIEVTDVEIIRKGAEIDYEIEIPTPVGVVQYCCKAKAKKKINDSDIAAAYVLGETKKLPVLYLTTGKLTKKAVQTHNRFANFKVIKLR